MLKHALGAALPPTLHARHRQPPPCGTRHNQPSPAVHTVSTQGPATPLQPPATPTTRVRTHHQCHAAHNHALARACPGVITGVGAAVIIITPCASAVPGAGARTRTRTSLCTGVGLGLTPALVGLARGGCSHCVTSSGSSSLLRLAPALLALGHLLVRHVHTVGGVVLEWWWGRGRGSKQARGVSGDFVAKSGTTTDCQSSQIRNLSQ